MDLYTLEEDIKLDKEEEEEEEKAEISKMETACITPEFIEQAKKDQKIHDEKVAKMKEETAKDEEEDDSDDREDFADSDLELVKKPKSEADLDKTAATSST